MHLGPARGLVSLCGFRPSGNLRWLTSWRKNSFCSSKVRSLIKGSQYKKKTLTASAGHGERVRASTRPGQEKSLRMMFESCSTVIDCVSPYNWREATKSAVLAQLRAE